MGVLLINRENDALDINPPSGDITLGVNGSNWLWAATAVYCITLVLLLVLTYFARAGEKIFHYLFTIALFSGSIAYFAMASDLGSVAVPVSNNPDKFAGARQIFYAKYINWFVGWTPLTIAVSLLSGVSWATVIYHVGLVWVWIASWLASALTETNYKWGFFTFGLIAQLALSFSLLHIGRLAADRVGISRHYLPITGWLVFLWLLYPIAYGVSDGGNEITVTSSFIYFGILDVLTVPLLAYAFLLLSSSWDYGVLNLQFTQYGRVPAQAGTYPEREKQVPATATGAA
jgi:bacteriorhodopsin